MQLTNIEVYCTSEKKKHWKCLDGPPVSHFVDIIHGL